MVGLGQRDVWDFLGRMGNVGFTNIGLLYLLSLGGVGAC